MNNIRNKAYLKQKKNIFVKNVDEQGGKTIFLSRNQIKNG